MKRNIYYFNNLLRTYNKYRRKLVNLRKANKNERRQHILQNHIAKLYEKLMVLKMSVKLTTVAASVVVGTLAFAPQTVQGQITFGAVQTNPFGLSDVGYNSNPVFVDLDNDGDLDMLAGANDGNFFYFQNTGTTTAPVFAPVQINPFGLVDIGYLSDPTIADLDNDGDLDMLTGDTFGNFSYFENTGTPSAPVFAPFTVNPFGLTNNASRSTPTFVDLDNDGDLDILSGTLSGGNFNYFENTGTPTTPVFAPFTTNPFGLVNVTNRSTPTFADLDGDGDLDMSTGDNNLNIKYFENIGTLTAPSFAPFTTNPFGLGGTNFYFTPTFTDLDNDGDLDLMAGENAGNFIYFENITPCTTDQTLTASQTTFCDSGTVTITIGSSETGINYYLRNDVDSSVVAGPVAGTGSGLTFNTGTINSTTTYNVYAVKPNAVNLSGATDRIVFNAPFSTYTNAITIEAWVNFTSTSPADFPWAGQTSSNIDNMGTNVWLWHSGLPSPPTFYVNDNGNWRALDFPAISSTGWHHVATVANATGLFIYYDGVLVASNTTGISSSIRNNASSVMVLGEDPRYINSPSRNSNVAFDNFSVWNVARTASEISTNLNNCLLGTEPGLVQYTKMNEGTGTTLNSLAGANGTITNGIANPWVTGSGVCDDACALEMTQTVTITVNNSTSSSQTFVECAGFSVTVGTNTYNTTGIYTDVLVGSNGCDSTVTTDLTIKQPTTGSQTLVECAGFSVTVGTNTYNTTGIYTDVLVGSNGCDSTVTTDLTIKQPTTGSQTLVECAGFSVTVGTNTYNATGVYTDVLTGSNGCDSTVTTDLTIEQAIDVTVDNSLAPTLSANQTGATYQWLDCDNGNVIIPSETAQSFTATVNGNYAVEITVGSCVDTSACENISTVGVKETANDVVSIYPNPTSGMVNINLGSNNSSVNYSITSIEGKVVETGKTSTNNIMVDLSKEGNGVYFVKINTENTSTVYKLIKQ